MVGSARVSKTPSAVSGSTVNLGGRRAPCSHTRMACSAINACSASESGSSATSVAGFFFLVATVADRRTLNLLPGFFRFVAATLERFIECFSAGDMCAWNARVRFHGGSATLKGLSETTQSMSLRVPFEAPALPSSSPVEARSTLRGSTAVARAFNAATTP